MWPTPAWQHAAKQTCWGSTGPRWFERSRFGDPTTLGTRTTLTVMCCAARAARCAARATRGGRRARGTRKPLPTLKQLREKLKELGLPSSGKKADLLEALRQAVLEAEDLLEPEVLPPKMVKSGGDGEGVHPVDTKMRSSWQAVTVSLEEDSEVIRPGDRVFLRAHTGRYIEVERDRACARWDDCGGWQELVIEKSPLVIEDTDPTLFHPGDLIFLKAHTGCYLEVQGEGSPVQARWEDLGVWQGLELAKKDTDPLRVGDILFLKSHTGLYVDVQGDGVQARWADEGDWQALTISR
ncbi:SAP domain-containing protein [Durusdinium trenchii]|uniref:SAP domain-containing protein n=1 Tax=Durusdinium trenchii TaxID=1381693 RepID=A0ABP0K8I2_9DINO